MCGRATVVNPDGIVERVYGYTSRFVPTDWKPRYNLSPREGIPVVYFDPVLRDKVLRVMHWNLIPSSLASRREADCFDARYSCFNARLESVATAPTFRDSWRSRRCLVVVDGMIEWVGEKGHKIPHLIRHKGESPFAMAGLWNRWKGGGDGDEIWSCTVLVRDASEWYSRFHHRMAVLASPEMFDDWLDPARKTGQLDLLRQAPYQMYDGRLRERQPAFLSPIRNVPTVCGDQQPAVNYQRTSCSVAVGSAGGVQSQLDSISI